MVAIAMSISHWGTVARPLAFAELALGRPDIAIDRLDAAIAAMARCGALPWTAEAQLDLAEVLSIHRAHTTTGRVSELVAEAGAAAARLGLVELRERADGLATRLAAVGESVVARERIGELDASAEAPTVAPRIRVLGRFGCVDVDGNDVAWNSRKARALLKLLVDARGAHVPREVLIERLWPGASPSAVSNRLSVAISTVRRSLDPRGALPRSSLVGVDRDTVWLEVARVGVDLESFLQAAATALRHGERREPAEQLVHRLRSAATLHGGTAFADDPYDDWWAATREHVRSVYSEVCLEIAATARIAWLDAIAAGALRSALEVDPYDERAHRAELAS